MILTGVRVWYPWGLIRLVYSSTEYFERGWVGGWVGEWVRGGGDESVASAHGGMKCRV